MNQPSDPQNLTMDQALDLAVQHHNAGDLEQAEEIYQQILEADPKHPVALHLLGVVASQVGEFEDAAELISSALEIVPDYAEAHLNLGNVLVRLDRLDETIDHYQKAIEIDPDYAEAHLNLAGLQQQRGELDDAVDHYQKFIGLDPDFVEAHLKLGRALQDLGKLDAAAAHYQKAIDIDPQSAEAYNYLGSALLKLGRAEEAADSYKNAIRIFPNSHLIHFNLHTTYYGSEDMEPAARCLEEAAKLEPNDIAIKFFRGMISDVQGNTEQAEIHFKAIPKDDEQNIARLDSWHYIKSSSTNPPPLFWDVEEGLRLAMAAANNEGLTLEFGVASGGSIRQLGALAGQDVHGFDSFEGIPDAWNNFSSGAFSTHGKLPKVPDNVHLHVGLFDASLPTFLSEHTGPLRFLHVDCDLYGSTKTIFDLLGDRIVSGTIILFDEYQGYPGWRDHEFRAFQEAVEKYGWQYDYLGFSFSSQQAFVKIR
ncbi:MAG: tetratricopeptide repeat protein [Rhodospirillaceae bacterium]|jgi:tetratricopeptide (TPR) repeat protein|nr:tetratricopeptide repeat protein [Rhodospirillaceae bacterium]